MVNIIKIGILLLLSSAVCFASSNKTILESKTMLMYNGKIIGFSPILTPVKVIKDKTYFTQSNKSIGFSPILPLSKVENNRTRVKIKGFRKENYPNIVLGDMKRGVLYAKIEDENNAKKAFKLLKKHEDDYGEVWHEVEGEFLISLK